VIAKAASKAGEQNLMLGRLLMIERERAGLAKRAREWSQKMPNTNSYKHEVKGRKIQNGLFAFFLHATQEEQWVKSTMNSLRSL
jgi:hypothetical protein